MNESESNDATRRFIWAIQALALPAVEQERLFPDFAEAADELALDHEEAQEAFLESREGERLTDTQRDALSALDAQLEGMSGTENSRFWTADAMREAPEWASVRALASRVLATMGWKGEPPPRDRAIYVGPPSK